MWSLFKKLKLRKGPRLVGEGEVEYPLSVGNNVIGKWGNIEVSPSCAGVEDFHAVVVVFGSGLTKLFVEEQTFVNGREVPSFTTLYSGDEIHLGPKESGVTFTFVA